MKKNRKKAWPIILILVLIVSAVAVTVFFVSRNKKKKEADEDKVYVESVSEITGQGFSNMDRFMGVVESQEIKYVDKSSDKVVKEIFVEEGAVVKEGDQLFSYDTDDMTLKLRQMELELTSINNSITTANQQIAALAKERDEAPAEEKIDYTTQIQSIQTQINQYNYDASSKQLEIDRQKLAIENSIVFSPMDGVVKKINNDSSSSDQSGYEYGYGGGSVDESSNHFISIMAMGDYRIKCTGDEMNVRSLFEGQPMIIVSRTNENESWTGTISLVDLENPVSNNNDYYYTGSETTTKYSFYIDLDSSEGLMLGQHVYSEMDFGQGAAKEGLWLYEFYIVQDDGDPYVWAENENGRIEKRKVILGEYDADLMTYEITDGISTADYIAFPENRIREGMKTTRNIEDVMPDMSDDMNIDDGMYMDEEGYIDDGMYMDEEGYIDDGMYMDEEGYIDEDINYDDGVEEGNTDEIRLDVPVEGEEGVE
ncbi:MAG: efflux RND transporter periplasmic adaptor subunit [Lachnospiraceae bacterium]|nr:efflux RND transporter periplasmic adaptor subunit [Lachnospiraceae bacterium]